jgi:hypothetical protein
LIYTGWIVSTVVQGRFLLELFIGLSIFILSLIVIEVGIYFLLRRW